MQQSTSDTVLSALQTAPEALPLPKLAFASARVEPNEPSGLMGAACADGRYHHGKAVLCTAQRASRTKSGGSHSLSCGRYTATHGSTPTTVLAPGAQHAPLQSIVKSTLIMSKVKAYIPYRYVKAKSSQVLQPNPPPPSLPPPSLPPSTPHNVHPQTKTLLHRFRPHASPPSSPPLLPSAHLTGPRLCLYNLSAAPQPQKAIRHIHIGKNTQLSGSAPWHKRAVHTSQRGHFADPLCHSDCPSHASCTMDNLSPPCMLHPGLSLFATTRGHQLSEAPDRWICHV